MKHRLLPRCLALLLFAHPAVAAPAQDWDAVPQDARPGLREAVQEATHGFRRTDAGWAAPNPGQQWTAALDGAGFSVRTQSPADAWGLELVSFGLTGSEKPAAPAGEGRAEGTRLTVARGAGLDEWLINDERGLEHGFTVHERPAGAGTELALHFTVRGGLAPQIAGNALHFQDSVGTTTLTYSGLKAWDADGRVLRSWFTVEGGKKVALRVEEKGARYPLTIDPLIQQAFLKASNADAGDYFGTSVAVHHNGTQLWAVVGAPSEASAASGVNGNQTDNSMPGAGAAYVFVRNGETWTQHAYLKASNPDSYDGFGTSVAIHGRMIIVGAPGEASAATGVNGNQADNSDGARGAAYVFFRPTNTWGQTAYLKRIPTGAGATAYNLGRSVALWGDGSTYTFLAGADENRVLNQFYGTAFSWQGTTGGFWSPAAQQVLQSGSPEHNGFFGSSVTIDGNVCAVSEPRTTSGAGRVYTFSRTGIDQPWTLEASLGAVGAGYTAHSLSLSGSTLAIGAPDVGGVGSVRIYTRSGTVWSQQAALTSPNAYVNFGQAVSLSGNTLAVGCVNAYDWDTNRDGDAILTFSRTGSTWTETDVLVAIQSPPASQSYDMGYDAPVALASDGTILAGAPFEDSNARTINPPLFGGSGSQQDNSRGESGAVFVFGTTPDMSVFTPAGAPPLQMGAGYGMGSKPIANQTTPHTFSIHNSGNSPLSGLVITKSGVNGPDFLITQPNQTSLNPSASAGFTIIFAPQAGALGTRSATLSIASTDPDENPFTILLSGTATPEEPYIVTNAPVVNSSTSVTISGYVDPRGFFVNHGFEYGRAADVGAGSYVIVPFFGAASNTPRTFSTPFTVAANEDYAVRAYCYVSLTTWRGEWMPFSTKPRAVWTQQQFGANAAISDPRADADGDGISNLHEWLGSTSPTMPTAMPAIVPATVFSLPYRYFGYPLNNTRNGDEWIRAESSTDLLTWTAGTTWDLLPSGFPFDAGQYFPDGPRRFVRMTSGIHTTVPIPTLYSTGLSDARTVLADATLDPHYTIVEPSGGILDAETRTSARGWPIAPGVWMADNFASTWLQPQLASGDPAAGTYIYRTTFNIPWGVDLTQVSIAGRMAADNSVSAIRLNGAILPLSYGDFSSFSPEWIITRGFVMGTNTLEFGVSNAGDLPNPSGFRAEVGGSWQAAGMVPIPGLRSSGTSVLDGARMAAGSIFTGCYTDYGPPRVRSVAGWMGDAGNVGSAWLTPFADDDAEPGLYTYTVPFDLTTFDPQTVEIAGRFAFDDECTVLLNGTVIVPNVTWNGTTWAPFTISRDQRHLLQPGQNILEFKVYNANPGSYNPTGLRYEFLHAAAMKK